MNKRSEPLESNVVVSLCLLVVYFSSLFLISVFGCDHFGLCSVSSLCEISEQYEYNSSTEFVEDFCVNYSSVFLKM